VKPIISLWNETLYQWVHQDTQNKQLHTVVEWNLILMNCLLSACDLELETTFYELHVFQDVIQQISLLNVPKCNKLIEQFQEWDLNNHNEDVYLNELEELHLLVHQIMKLNQYNHRMNQTQLLKLKQHVAHSANEINEPTVTGNPNQMNHSIEDHTANQISDSTDENDVNAANTPEVNPKSLPPPPPPNPLAPPPPPSMGPPPPPPPLAKKTRRFQWTPLQSNQMHSTLWSNYVPIALHTSSTFNTIDHFFKKSMSSNVVPLKQPKLSKTILSPKKAKNISIMLSLVKGYTPTEIVQAVMEMNMEIITLDLVEQLLKFPISSADGIKLINELSSNLSRPDE
jgi:hypothetical protein